MANVVPHSTEGMNTKDQYTFVYAGGRFTARLSTLARERLEEEVARTGESMSEALVRLVCRFALQAGGPGDFVEALEFLKGKGMNRSLAAEVAIHMNAPVTGKRRK